MRLAAHLRRSRHGVFYFRIVIPMQLRAIFGNRREIIKTLATRDPKLAKLASYTLSAKVSAKFEQARAAMTKEFDPPVFNEYDPSSWPRAENASTYGLEIPGVVKLTVDTTIPGDHEKALEAVERLFDNPNLRDRGDKERAQLTQIAAEHLAERAQQLGIPASGTNTQLWGGYRPIRLSDAIAIYREEYLGGKAASTQKAYNHTLDDFTKFFDHDPFMHDINDVVVDKWKNTVVIPHFTKVAEDKVARDVARGRVVFDPLVGVPVVEAETRSVDAQITNLNAFFQVTKKKKRYPQHMELPTKDLTLVSSSARKDLPGWDMFEEHELQAIFAPENILAFQKPHEFWMPLLGLFTGARLNELAQLTHDDFQKESGKWVMWIRDTDYFQQVKNKSSGRKIPLHPVLGGLGLIKYLKDVCKAVPENRRIFPYLRFDKNNGFGDVPSESFRRYLNHIGIHGKGKVYHSLRKNANQRMGDNNVDEAHCCQMLGHAHNTTNVRVYRKNKFTVQFLREHVVPKFTFPEIDFRPLKYKPGRFLMILRTEYDAAIGRRRINKDETSRLQADAVKANESRPDNKKR